MRAPIITPLSASELFAFTLRPRTSPRPGLRREEKPEEDQSVWEAGLLSAQVPHSVSSETNRDTSDTDVFPFLSLRKDKEQWGI